MKKTSYLSWSAIVLCALLCTACTDTFSYWAYVPDITKQLVPYRDGEIIYFADGAGQLIPLTVNIEDVWVLREEFEATDEYPNTRDYAEYRFINLHSPDHTHDISIELDPNYNDRVPLFVRVAWRNSRRVRLEFDETGSPVQLSNTMPYFDIQDVYDSLAIGGQMYYGVAKGTSYLYDTPSESWRDTMYCWYNTSHGILRLLENGELFLERRSNP